MKKSVFFAFCLVLGGFFSVTLTAQTLAPSVSAPVADGIINASEYSLSGTYTGMNMHSSLSSDGKTLFLALEAPCSGWVSIGIGSLKMNGAFMVLGYDANGSVVISEETGKGHSRTKNPGKILTASSVREANGSTVLEFAIPASNFVSGNTLKLIMAYGKKDNLNSFHTKYDSVELALQK